MRVCCYRQITVKILLTPSFAQSSSNTMLYTIFIFVVVDGDPIVYVFVYKRCFYTSSPNIITEENKAKHSSAAMYYNLFFDTHKQGLDSDSLIR